MGPPAKSGGKGLIIAIGVLVGVLLIAGGVLLAWKFMGGSSSVAHEHLPKGCDAVVRIDFEGLMSVPAIKKHVLPAISKKASKAKDSGKVAKFFWDAGVNPKTDVKEAVLCVANINPASPEPEVVAVIGGSFKKNAIVDAIDKHDKKDKFKDPKKKGGLKVLEAKDKKVFITQADDGALLVGSKWKLVKKASKTSSNHKKTYKLPLDEQIVGIITAKAIGRLSALAGKMGSSLSGAGQMTFTISLKPGKIGATLVMPSAKAASDLATQLTAMLTMAKASAGTLPPEAKETVDGATVKADGKKVIATAPISKAAITEGAKQFAKGLKKADDKI